MKTKANFEGAGGSRRSQTQVGGRRNDDIEFDWKFAADVREDGYRSPRDYKDALYSGDHETTIDLGMDNAADNRASRYDD